MQLAPLDWVMLVALAASLVLGAWRGLVYEVILALGWIAAFVLSQWFAPALSQWLPAMRGASEPVRYAVAFVLVFIGAIFAAGLLAWITKKLVEAVGLRPVDRILGALFGVARGALALLALAVVVNMTGLREHDWWRQSQGASVATSVLVAIKPLLPGDFGQYLPGQKNGLAVSRG